MPSVRGFLFKDLKQCLRKEHCDVSCCSYCYRFSKDLQMVNLSVLWVNDEAANSIPFHFLFLPLERTACQLKCSWSKGKSLLFRKSVARKAKATFYVLLMKGQ